MDHSNVYVRGVPIGWDTEELRYLFNDFGPILSAKILEPRHVGDKRLGFVKFASQNDARHAIEAMDGCEIAGQVLEVRQAESDVDPKRTLLSKALVENDNLFVRGFPSYWGMDKVTEFFSQAGVVVSVRILDCSIPARGGVGLVRFNSIAEARTAIEQLNGVIVDGFGPIEVKYSTVKDPGQEGRSKRGPYRKHIVATSVAYRNAASLTSANDLATWRNNDVDGDRPDTLGIVFVGSLPRTMTELKLYQLFSPFGAVTSVTIGLDSSQACTGMAFVNFVQAEDAWKAAMCVNGSEIDGNIITVMSDSSNG